MQVSMMYHVDIRRCRVVAPEKRACENAAVSVEITYFKQTETKRNIGTNLFVGSLHGIDRVGQLQNVSDVRDRVGNHGRGILGLHQLLDLRVSRIVQTGTFNILFLTVLKQ